MTVHHFFKTTQPRLSNQDKGNRSAVSFFARKKQIASIRLHERFFPTPMTNLKIQSASRQPMMPAATLQLTKRHFCQKRAKYFSPSEKFFSRQLLAPAFYMFFLAHYGIRTLTGIVVRSRTTPWHSGFWNLPPVRPVTLPEYSGIIPVIALTIVASPWRSGQFPS